jgi:hypothetical protein
VRDSDGAALHERVRAAMPESMRQHLDELEVRTRAQYTPEKQEVFHRRERLRLARVNARSHVQMHLHQKSISPHSWRNDPWYRHRIRLPGIRGDVGYCRPRPAVGRTPRSRRAVTRARARAPARLADPHREPEPPLARLRGRFGVLGGRR